MKKQLIVLCLHLLLLMEVKSQEKVTVHFDYNRAELTQTAKNTLDSLVGTNSAGTSFVAVTLSGHCDARGSDDYNDKLSGERVNAVQQYFVEKKNIREDLIKNVSALGKRQPLNENTNEADMALNRRVEIVIQRAVPEIKDKAEPLKTLTQQLKDTAIREGQTLVLRNMNFEGGRHVLLRASLPLLDELLNALNNSPTLEISIEGHVCCARDYVDGWDIDTRTFNLSVNRAKMVYDYLVKKGIAAERLSWDGYGNKYPIIPIEVTEGDRMTNRRVEIKILRK